MLKENIFHDGSKYNKRKCKNNGECKECKRVKNRCVCNKGYKLNDSEYKQVNEECKVGIKKGKIYICPKQFKVNKREYKNEEENCKVGKMIEKKYNCLKGKKL